MGCRPDTTGKRLYQWFYANSEADGAIETSCGTIAKALNQPLRTIQGALQRLQDRGQILMYAPRKFAVVAKDPGLNGEW
jgi:hypothetical protein